MIYLLLSMLIISFYLMLRIHFVFKFRISIIDMCFFNYAAGVKYIKGAGIESKNIDFDERYKIFETVPFDKMIFSLKKLKLKNFYSSEQIKILTQV